MMDLVQINNNIECNTPSLESLSYRTAYPAKDWENISEISYALKPIKIATKCLQQQQLTYGKSFGT
jgi:hypothetical protein